MTEITLKGSCLCGAVRYEVSGDPQRFYHCHCSRCRKSSGAGHASNVFLTEAELMFTSGKKLVKKYKIPGAKRFARQFCSECGCQVARVVPELEAVIIPAGSLDDEIPIRPQARIFWDSRAEWSCGGGDLPCFAELPG